MLIYQLPGLLEKQVERNYEKRTASVKNRFSVSNNLTSFLHCVQNLPGINAKARIEYFQMWSSHFELLAVLCELCAYVFQMAAGYSDVIFGLDY